MSVCKWEQYGGVKFPIDVWPAFIPKEIPMTDPIPPPVTVPTDHRFTISMVIEGAHVKIRGKRENGQTLYGD